MAIIGATCFGFVLFYFFRFEYLIYLTGRSMTWEDVFRLGYECPERLFVESGLTIVMCNH